MPFLSVILFALLQMFLCLIVLLLHMGIFFLELFESYLFVVGNLG